MVVRDIAFYDAQIALADEWLDTRADALFRDRRKGELWPIVGRRDGWVKARALLVDKMPEDAGRHTFALAGSRGWVA